jgi:4-methoxybenzoate monooxygenase (O-demethylating)
LRWDSTVQLFFRTTRHPLKMDGTIIPEWSKVLLFYAAANRDPRTWLGAERFDITRSASGHLAFGFGVHQCLSQMVARQEAGTVLAALIPPDRGNPPYRRSHTAPEQHAACSGRVPVEFVAA